MTSREKPIVRQQKTCQQRIKLVRSQHERPFNWVNLKYKRNNRLKWILTDRNSFLHGFVETVKSLCLNEVTFGSDVSKVELVVYDQVIFLVI
jgi:hypothetical protein